MTARVVAFAVVIVALALFPSVAGNYPVKLLQEILIWGVFAMSLDLLMGFTGMVSFGHSAFFGLGATSLPSRSSSRRGRSRASCCRRRRRRWWRSWSASSLSG